MPVPLSSLDWATSASVCGGFAALCVVDVRWGIQLAGGGGGAGSSLRSPCIGAGEQCAWRDVNAYLAAGQPDTWTYVVLEANMTVSSLSSSTGSTTTTSMAWLMTWLRSLRCCAAQARLHGSLAQVQLLWRCGSASPPDRSPACACRVCCTSPRPAYAAHVLGGLINMTRNISSAADGPGGAALYRVPSLTHLALPSCALTGQLPVELGALPNLQHLDLSSNLLTGALPPLHPAVRAPTLNLSGNLLAGRVDAGWAVLARCGGVVDLSNNLLSVSGTWSQSARTDGRGA